MAASKPPKGGGGKGGGGKGGTPAFQDLGPVKNGGGGKGGGGGGGIGSLLTPGPPIPYNEPPNIAPPGVKTPFMNEGKKIPGWVAPEEPKQDPFDQSAFDYMYSLLAEYGLTSLANFLRGLILGGTTDSASLMLALQGTNEWKQRFAGNEMLRSQGLGVLSPAEYLATERQYAQIMKNYGLPQGFYDDPSDFAQWIGKSVSPNELQQRVSMYADLAGREDQTLAAQLQSMGMSRGDLLAYMIDPSRATPLIQRQYQTALLGGASRRAGFVADNSYLEQLAARGITEEQASQGFGLIASSLADAKDLASIYGVDYGVGDMQAEVFDNNAQAATKRRRLASQERAAFSGSSGTGNLEQETAGQY